MSLPSQSSRNATRSSQVHYRRSSASPARKFLGVIFIIAAIVAVWFYFIRPQAKKLTQEQAQAETQNGAQDRAQDRAEDGQQLASSAGRTPKNSPTTQAPTIITNSPNRPLPGAGDRPDPSDEVQRAIRSNQPDEFAGTLPDSRPTNSTPTNTDILDAATKHATTPPERPAARTTTPPHSGGSSNGVRLQIDTARRLVAENNRVGARKLLSEALMGADITHREAQILRDELTAINEVLLFSPVVDPKDPMTESYTIKAGDSLSRIASRRELATHWKLIARVNQIADPSKIRLGQNLKLVRGPFHAVVHKSAHRLDIFHGSPDSPESWLYIKSFDVGLGSNDGTPIGEFVVSSNKLENPGWVNPRDAREQYSPNDPKNPIGEFWIGLTGVGKYSSLTSLGIHGTIDPDSIGDDRSMGCVRLAQGDIDMVYELLAEHISRVMIVP